MRKVIFGWVNVVYNFIKNLGWGVIISSITAVAMTVIALIELRVLYIVIDQNNLIIKSSEKQIAIVSDIENTDKEEERRKFTLEMILFINQQGFYDNAITGATSYVRAAKLKVSEDPSFIKNYQKAGTANHFFENWIKKEIVKKSNPSELFRPEDFREDFGMFADKLIDVAQCICKNACDPKIAGFMIGLEIERTAAAFAVPYCENNSRNLETLARFFHMINKDEYNDELCQRISEANTKQTVLCGKTQYQ